MGKGLPRSLERAGIVRPSDRGSVSLAGTSLPDAAHQTIGGLRKETIELTDVEVSLTDEAGVVAYGGVKVYDFPEGLISWQGAVLDLALTKDAAGVNDDWDGDVSLGTATAGNDDTLSGTEADLVPSTATPQASSGATTADASSTGTEVGAIHDGSATAKDIYLNFLVDDDDQDVTSTPTNLIVNGTITFYYTDLGDL